MEDYLATPRPATMPTPDVSSVIDQTNHAISVLSATQDSIGHLITVTTWAIGLAVAVLSLFGWSAFRDGIRRASEKAAKVAEAAAKQMVEKAGKDAEELAKTKVADAVANLAEAHADELKRIQEEASRELSSIKSHMASQLVEFEKQKKELEQQILEATAEATRATEQLSKLISEGGTNLQQQIADFSKQCTARGKELKSLAETKKRELESVKAPEPLVGSIWGNQQIGIGTQPRGGLAELVASNSSLSLGKVQIHSATTSEPSEKLHVPGAINARLISDNLHEPSGTYLKTTGRKSLFDQLLGDQGSK